MRSLGKAQGQSAGDIARNGAKETTEVPIPSQTDLFRDIGECLRVGIGRTGKQEDTPLEAIIYFVRETAGGTQAA